MKLKLCTHVNIHKMNTMIENDNYLRKHDGGRSWDHHSSCSDWSLGHSSWRVRGSFQTKACQNPWNHRASARNPHHPPVLHLKTTDLRDAGRNLNHHQNPQIRPAPSQNPLVQAALQEANSGPTLQPKPSPRHYPTVGARQDDGKSGWQGV